MPEPESTEPATDTTAAAAADAQRSAPQPEAAAPKTDADPAAQLAAAKAEAAANYDRFLRATADLENFRRRAVREKDE